MNTKSGLTAEQLEKLLTWLHADRDRAAERYELTRLKLIEWFERRGSGSGEELADVVLDRVARRLDEGEDIRSVGFFLGVARNVFLESRSRSGAHAPALSDVAERADSTNPEQLLADAEDEAVHRLRVAIMVRRLRELPADERQLIREYYGENARGTRATIARRLGLSTAGLYTRIHRLCKRLAAGLDASEPAASPVKDVMPESHKK